MIGLGNERVLTQSGEMRLHDEAAVSELLDLVIECDASKRRVIFFCACKTPQKEGERFCHRDLIAELLVKEAQRRKVALSVVEWPGGAPRHLTVAFPPAAARAREEGAQSVPVPRGISHAAAVAVPWGSYALVGEDDVPVIVGPAIHSQGRWAFPLPWPLVEAGQTEPQLKKEITELREAWGYEPRYSVPPSGVSQPPWDDVSSPSSRARTRISPPGEEELSRGRGGLACEQNLEEEEKSADDRKLDGVPDGGESPEVSLAELLGIDSEQWSRPRAISRVLAQLGEDVPHRLRSIQFRGLITTLGSVDVQVCLADDPEARVCSPIDESPGIAAKVRLRAGGEVTSLPAPGTAVVVAVAARRKARPKPVTAARAVTSAPAPALEANEAKLRARPSPSRSRARGQIFSFGYTGSKPEILAEVARSLDAIVLDVRGSPRSRVAHWNRKALEKLLGDRYEWRGETLGNRGPYQVTPKGLDALMRLDTNALLLCACEVAGDCHRHQAIGVPLAQRGVTVRHVYPSRLDDRKLTGHRVVTAAELQRASDRGEDYECADLTDVIAEMES
jgi:hypothetical protein